MKKLYKAAVIGCGRIGMLMEEDPKRLKPATHVGAYLRNQRTELVAVAEMDSAKREKAKTIARGAEIFTDAREMLVKVRPDIVSVSTFHDDENDQHYPMALLAAELGIPAIVCEKPIASTIGKGREMVAACEKSGSLLFVNHIRRFEPLLGEWQKRLADGVIGEIQQATGYYSIGLYHMGTHLVDFLRFYLGDVEWVAGWNNLRAHAAVPGDWCVDGILGFKSGAHVAIQSTNVKDYSMFEVRVLGRKGELFIRDLGRTVELTPAAESKQYAGFFELDPERRETHHGREQSFFVGLVENVVASLDGTEAPKSTGRDGLRVIEVLAALRESANNDGWKIVLPA
ncbi:MAG: Gfo/Idh/MocA family oxidoreductase [Parcubacteria group bacterium]|nr:Gfo/Idh/MocA family oxidoreductase [Parcubacteria group bacterium]